MPRKPRAKKNIALTASTQFARRGNADKPDLVDLYDDGYGTGAIDPGLSAREARRGLSAYNDWHWGIPASSIRDWNEPDFPRMLIGCGHLARVHIRLPRDLDGRHPRRQVDDRVQFSRSDMMRSFVGFDPDHAHQRLYFLINRTSRPFLAKQFWAPNTAQAMPLARVAAIAGGRHARDAYPNVTVKPVGALTGVMYYTHKKGDESPQQKESFYLHQMGEVSGGFPILCVDAQGRFWAAGGSYTAPNAGISD